jgi:hypothetical protein
VAVLGQVPIRAVDVDVKFPRFRGHGSFWGD